MNFKSCQHRMTKGRFGAIKRNEFIKIEKKEKTER